MREYTKYIATSGYSLVAEWLLAMEQTGVRLPLPAPKIIFVTMKTYEEIADDVEKLFDQEDVDGEEKLLSYLQEHIEMFPDELRNALLPLLLSTALQKETGRVQKENDLAEALVVFLQTMSGRLSQTKTPEDVVSHT